MPLSYFSVFSVCARSRLRTGLLAFATRLFMISSRAIPPAPLKFFLPMLISHYFVFFPIVHQHNMGMFFIKHPIFTCLIPSPPSEFTFQQRLLRKAFLTPPTFPCSLFSYISAHGAYYCSRFITFC